MAIYLTEKDVQGLLTMDVALEAVEEGFRHQAGGSATNFPRRRLPLSPGSFNFMAAAAPVLGVMGIKTYGVMPTGQLRFYVQLYSSATGEMLALIEASHLGQVRTGAASGVATRYMSRDDAETVGMIGAGYQAGSQLEAVCKVRNIKKASIFSRTPEKKKKLAEIMSVKLGIDVVASDSAETAVRGSDIVITITSSSRPVLCGEWLSPGMHVNAAGANHWMRRELDTDAVVRADIVVADDVEGAKIECGDLIHPTERGAITWQRVRNLSDVVAGTVQGRTSPRDITLFESQGVALEDIAVAARLYDLAGRSGVGKKLSP